MTGYLVSFWNFTLSTLSPFLRDLDPSLFQNIILGVLAIFIPFAIVFLTDLLDHQHQRGEFEKMVLSEEVLGTKKIFWQAIVGIIVFAFFSGTTVSEPRKILAILLALIFIWFFWRPFSRILRFSEGYKPEFELSFLRGLRLSIFRIGNKLRMDRMGRAWGSFWSEKTNINERDYTKIFIDHIDQAIAHGRYDLAIALAQAYEKNVDKRDRFSLGYEVLPKALQWHEQLWHLEQRWLRREDAKDKFENKISAEYFPTFKKVAVWVLNKVRKPQDYFWNWHYFQQAFIPAVSKALLYDSHGAFQLFSCLKKYVDEAESKIDSIEDGQKKERWWGYIVAFMSSFCEMFFANIDKVPSNYDIWHHYFPPEWKITSANANKRIPRVILQSFLQWSQSRIFKTGSEHDPDLTEVAGGLFPNVHHTLFPEFMVLFFSVEPEYAIKQQPNFFLINTSISWSGEKSDEEVQKMFTDQDLSQKRETVEMIFKYLHNWSTLTLYKDDLTEQEQKDWETYSEEQRKEIVRRVRKKKLGALLTAFEAPEMIALCADDERKEYRRLRYIELVKLLLDYNAIA